MRRRSTRRTTCRPWATGVAFTSRTSMATASRCETAPATPSRCAESSPWASSSRSPWATTSPPRGARFPASPTATRMPSTCRFRSRRRPPGSSWSPARATRRSCSRCARPRRRCGSRRGTRGPSSSATRSWASRWRAASPTASCCPALWPRPPQGRRRGCPPASRACAAAAPARRRGPPAPSRSSASSCSTRPAARSSARRSWRPRRASPPGRTSGAPPGCPTARACSRSSRARRGRRRGSRRRGARSSLRSPLPPALARGGERGLCPLLRPLHPGAVRPVLEAGPMRGPSRQFGGEGEPGPSARRKGLCRGPETAAERPFARGRESSNKGRTDMQRCTEVETSM
mmetsp:Transcript_8641/g.24279  ORF Transcript_8641/g.24279 Transcript_8641/m.24279 type:complete len:345 (+) Transcript_8641:541-1575(+)